MLPNAGVLSFQFFMMLRTRVTELLSLARGDTWRGVRVDGVGVLDAEVILVVKVCVNVCELGFVVEAVSDSVYMALLPAVYVDDSSALKGKCESRDRALGVRGGGDKSDDRVLSKPEYDRDVPVLLFVGDEGRDPEPYPVVLPYPYPVELA